MMLWTLLFAAPLVQPPEAVDLDPADDVVRVQLRAEELADGSYGYNGSSPGPTIRLRVGQTLIADIDNALSTPTTVHWHGINVPFEMDGVVWMSDPILPGSRRTVQFAAEKAGTFWYHPHFDTAGQVDRGLYGLVIVEDPDEPQLEDIVLIADAGREHEPDARHAHGHGRMTRWTLNGVEDAEITLEGGRRYRLRVLNASNAGYLNVWQDNLQMIARGQGLLPSPIQGPALVSAGDRAEFELRPATKPITIEALPYSLNGGESYEAAQAILRINVANPAPEAAPAPFFWTEQTPTVTPTHADLMYVFSGSDRARRWFINGQTFPGTIEELALGQSAIIEVRNVSPTEHPFHLHGLHFEVLSRDGVAPAHRWIADTINVRILERVRLRVVADNPGDWMLHCHILPHADDGMMTILRVR